MADTVGNEIKAFIIENFLFGQEGRGFSDDESFLENGIIDSTGLLELVAFVEERYGITIADRELLPENLDSLQNITAFIARKRETATA